VLKHLPAHQVSVLTGKRFFPELLSGPFHHGLVIVFSTAMFFLVIAAIASALRGGRYVYDDQAGQAASALETSAASNGQPAPSGSQQSASNGASQSPSADGQAAAKGRPVP
jgi:hypothetical protein